jgi:hypothetical protein
MRKAEQLLKRSLFIFGSFSCGWVLGIILHELGHAVSMWITGGVVDRITISPFSWSYTYYGSVPKYPNFTTWSGILIGSLFGLVILLAIARRPTPYLVPLVFTGVTPMLQGGGYYLIDTFISKEGDAASLIESGIPMTVVLGAAILIATMGVFFVIRFIYWNGIDPGDKISQRALTLVLGMVPYFVLALIYGLVYEPEDILQKVLAIGMVSMFAVFLALVSMRYPKMEERKPLVRIEWHHVLYAMGLGIAAMVVPYLGFAS